MSIATTHPSEPLKPQRGGMARAVGRHAAPLELAEDLLESGYYGHVAPLGLGLGHRLRDPTTAAEWRAARDATNANR